MTRGSRAGFARISRAFLFILGPMLLALPLYADTFNVNSTADEASPAPGTVTLRSAITAVNSASSSGENIINLTVAGTYKITLGAFAISPSGDLTIINTSGG